MNAPRLLAEPSAFLAALDDLVTWSEQLDLAYAWMDSNGGTTDAWELLDETKIRRAVVGVHFGRTEPYAVEYLHRAAPDAVRIIEDRDGTFHPKVIVGTRKSKRRAIIGSSNFTRGGFETNTELNVVIEGGHGDKFFRDLDFAIGDYWRKAKPVTPESLDRVKRAWKNRSKPTKTRILAVEHNRACRDLPKTLDFGWPEYVTLLESQRRRHPGLRLSAAARDSDQHSYLGEARRARELFAQKKPYAKLDYPDRRLIAGFGPNAGYFGSTGGNGVWKNLVREHAARIGRIIDPIPLRGKIQYSLVKQAFQAAEKLDRVKMGCTTRLLCMKRPDLFFPVNAGNRRLMRKMLGGVPRNADEYIELLERIHAFAWFKSGKPEDEYDRELWSNRVGLLDAVFYDPA